MVHAFNKRDNGITNLNVILVSNWMGWMDDDFGQDGKGGLEEIIQNRLLASLVDFISRRMA